MAARHIEDVLQAQVRRCREDGHRLPADRDRDTAIEMVAVATTIAGRQVRAKAAVIPCCRNVEEIRERGNDGRETPPVSW